MGTAFILLRLASDPSVPPFPPGIIDTPHSKAQSQGAPARPIILLIEDNSADINVIQRALKQCGISIDLQIAEDGERALSMLQRFEHVTARLLPSLILLDWNLPRISGAEILAYVRRSEPLQQVPVVVVTSTDSPKEVREIKSLGATVHFRKPTDLDAYLDLGRIVLELLPKSPPS